MRNAPQAQEQSPHQPRPWHGGRSDETRRHARAMPPSRRWNSSRHRDGRSTNRESPTMPSPSSPVPSVTRSPTRLAHVTHCPENGNTATNLTQRNSSCLASTSPIRMPKPIRGRTPTRPRDVGTSGGESSLSAAEEQPSTRRSGASAKRPVVPMRLGVAVDCLAPIASSWCSCAV